ncbi:MAG: hypothetical protein V3V96_02315 [Acidiferrobacterales bacterium]
MAANIPTDWDPCPGKTKASDTTVTEQPDLDEQKRRNAKARKREEIPN